MYVSENTDDIFSARNGLSSHILWYKMNLKYSAHSFSAWPSQLQPETVLIKGLAKRCSKTKYQQMEVSVWLGSFSYQKQILILKGCYLHGIFSNQFSLSSPCSSDVLSTWLSLQYKFITLINKFWWHRWDLYPHYKEESWGVNYTYYILGIPW
jgi:hypothetical protein